MTRLVVLRPVGRTDPQVCAVRRAVPQDAAHRPDDGIGVLGHDVVTASFCQDCWNANRDASTSWRWSAWRTPRA
ncbi:hypothetical protein PV367_44800 [Streptomyces europaeiscabiei]|uniref:Uncharacterized protein n=1 Tax=Streptomyces europaeiscabiei TaxID=146819 RepID=A0AAJ2PZS2_9ACTN|nr:hypothetical protein [Streptomyces europaeiscabiei]MDX3136760.1 hypothetical protein [Streptomyces europaeiscabiei]